MGIIGITALLTVLGLSLLITRLATVALSLTGLSYEAAQFQARSAFTGTGFTTSESETVVSHPVRRRIIMLLMLLRSAGIVTIILSLILSFMGTQESEKVQRLYWLVGGVAVLWILSLSRWVDRMLKRMMEHLLTRWTDLDVRDYMGLLKLSGDYVIRKINIKEGDWLADRTLSECRLREEGVSIIGVYRRNGNYVGAPRGSTVIYPGDAVVLYGRAEGLKNLDRRREGGEGDRDHDKAVGREEERMSEQEREEAAYTTERADSS